MYKYKLQKKCKYYFIYANYGTRQSRDISNNDICNIIINADFIR